MFNEATVIGMAVKRLLPSFPHVVCINDGSSDGSVDAALAAGAHVIRHPINLGQGTNLQTGFEFALQDPAMIEVLAFDADGQHQVDDAVGMIKRLRREKSDVVIGSRFLDERTQTGELSD